jgi:GAF domain-containing protein
MSQLYLSPELLDALQKLSTLVAEESTLEATLQTVVDLTAGTLPGCDSAGVTLHTDGGETTAAASDEFTLEIDRIQYSTEQGPCLQAMRDGKIVRLEAVSEETRWPDFVIRAAEAGFASSLSFPLKVNGSIGALNIYAKKEHAFDERGLALGEIYSKQAEIALINAHTYRAAKKMAAQLQEAIESRDLIGQAKGILMERESISSDEAFGMLVSASQAANIKVKEIARRLVEEKHAADAGP